MGHVELYVTWSLLAVVGLIAASTCLSVWRLQSDLREFRKQVFAYRETLD